MPKCVKYIKIYFKTKERLDFKVLWNFRPIWRWFGDIIRKIRKITSFACTHKTCFCYRYGIWKNNDLLSIIHSFFLESANFHDMGFTSIHVKKYTQIRPLINQTETKHGSVNCRSRNLGMTPERLFQFHKKL